MSFVNTDSYTRFDLFASLLGGIIIGIATSLNFILMGRITGHSGIFNTLIKLDSKNGLRWKFWFFAGFIYSGYLLSIISKDGVHRAWGFEFKLFDPKQTAGSGLTLYQWLIGGFLVGLGTKLGNGWTSGHGVCGLPRFSKRSLVAVAIFMATCALTVTFRNNFGFGYVEEILLDDTFTTYHKLISKFSTHLIFLSFIVFYLISIVMTEDNITLIEMPLSLAIGIIFGIGISVSGMWKRSKVYRFFTLNENWDPSLAFVMAGAVLVNTISFNVTKHNLRASVFNHQRLNQSSGKVDWKVMVGPALFGIGWGITGMCPGPAMINLFLIPQAVLYIVSLAAGQFTWEFVEKILASKGQNTEPNSKVKQD